MNDTSGKVGPALTPEEWRVALSGDSPRETGPFIDLGADGGPCIYAIFEGDSFAEVPHPYAMAALCLGVCGPEGKPLFTREMARTLRAWSRGHRGHGWDLRNERHIVESVADALESLLPPVEP